LGLIFWGKILVKCGEHTLFAVEKGDKLLMKNSSRITKGHGSRSRAISIVAAAILIATTLFIAPPTEGTTAYAEQIPAGAPEAAGTTFAKTSLPDLGSVIDIPIARAGAPDKPVDINMSTVSKSGTGYSFDGVTVLINENGYYRITGSTTTKRVKVKAGVSAGITLSDASIDRSAINYISETSCAFDQSGASVSLSLSGANTLASGYNAAGLQVPSGSALSLGGTGSLSVSSFFGTFGGVLSQGAAIGGGVNNDAHCGYITINSGTIIATGGSYGAGIGSGYAYYFGGNITINGGNVTVTGGKNGNAGIGGSGVNVTINGGKVNAKGGNRGAGIGAADLSSRPINVTITGGEVNAGGGIHGGAGIGVSSLKGSPEGIIVISGGTVVANGANSTYIHYGAGAGIGTNGANTELPTDIKYSITITGNAKVTATGGEAPETSTSKKSGGGAGIGGGGGCEGLRTPITILRGIPAGNITITSGTTVTAKGGAGYQGNGANIGGGGGKGVNGAAKTPGITVTKHTVTSAAGKGGNITPSGNTEFISGANATFVIKSDENYLINSIVVDGVKFAPSPIPTQDGYTYVLPGVKANHSISANFIRYKYTLLVKGGTGSGNYMAGETVIIKANPAPAGHAFYKWTGTGGKIADLNSPSTTFTMTAADATVTATYTSPKGPLLLSPPSAASPIDLTKLPLTAIKIADKAWTGKQIKRGVKIDLYYSVNGKAMAKTLTENVDYTVTAAGKNKNIGKGTLTISGKTGGICKGIKALNFKIVPKKPTGLKLKAGKKTLKITFKKVSKAQKVKTYKVQYRVKGTAKWKSKTLKVKLTGKAAKSKTTSLTLKKLKPKKTYQVKVYAYKGAYKGASTGMKSKKIK
jgi:hypothetical protein